MKVEYKGHKILRGLDGVDMRHLRPAAIITGKHEEKQLIDKVIAKSGYVGCVFDDDDGVHGIVTLDGKEDYRRFMRAWKAAKQEVMAAGRKETDRPVPQQSTAVTNFYRKRFEL